MAKKNRKPWWNYVRSIIREYPALKKERDTPLPPKTTQSFGSVGHGSGISDPTASAVIHDLPREKMRKLEAIEQAIAETKRVYDNWEIRLKVVDYVYWRRTTTVYGAAQMVYVHENTASKFSSDFIRLVAKYLDLPEAF